MAPVRKRGGAKGAKANNQLKLGDLVLAKVKGFPAWPAKISKPEDWQRTPDPRKYFVHFFGKEEIAFVAPVDIQLFTRESKDKLLNRCKGKTVKYFSQAVKEICDIFEELENKSSDSFKDGNDGQAFQSDANFMEMVDDGMTTNGPSGETSPSDILNHGPGLERCSQIQSEMESEDDIPDVSPLVDDHPSSLSTKTHAELCSDDATPPNVESICASGAGHSTNSNTGTNIETNGQKSKKIAKASKNNHDGVIRNNKSIAQQIINHPVSWRIYPIVLICSQAMTNCDEIFKTYLQIPMILREKRFIHHIHIHWTRSTTNVLHTLATRAQFTRRRINTTKNLNSPS